MVTIVKQGEIITVFTVGQRSFATVETLGILQAKQSDKGKTCVCGKLISVSKRKAYCLCGNPRIYQ